MPAFTVLLTTDDEMTEAAFLEMLETLLGWNGIDVGQVVNNDRL